MKRIVTGLFFLCHACIANAQEEFIEPPSQMIIRIPFTELTGGVIIIRARLGDSPDTLNFVLDTGSSGISVDSATAEYLKLKPVLTDISMRALGGIRKPPFLFNQKLHFPGFTVDSLDFHVTDYSVLTAVYGVQINGIIGYSLINRYIIKINYDNLTIDLCTKGTIRYPRGGHLLKPVMGVLPVQTIRVKDDMVFNGRFLFDIGAGLCIIFSKDFIDDSLLIKKKRKLWQKRGEGAGGKIYMQATTIKEVKLGPYRFRSVPVNIYDDVDNITSYPYSCGLIGNEILRRFNVILNYDKKDIYIIPNSHYNEPFDYSYPGIELYMVNEKIIVGDVVKGSPAEKAGILEDDEVIAVNNNFLQNLNLYKIALQATNQKVKLVIRRDGNLKEIEFRIKSIRR